MERQFAEVVTKASTIFLKDGRHTPILFIQRHERGAWSALQMLYENDAPQHPRRESHQRKEETICGQDTATS